MDWTGLKWIVIMDGLAGGWGEDSGGGGFFEGEGEGVFMRVVWRNWGD